MPELPEVETNAGNLRRWTRGRRVVKVTPPAEKRPNRTTGGVSARLFRERLEGRRVEDVTRRGKWIVVALSGGAALGLHLGMTGKIARAGRGQESPRFTRALFELDDGGRICFVDSRRFGKLLAVTRLAQLLEAGELATLGPDALAETTPALLRDLLARTARTVKETLMDQRVLAGLGNLYATEALWRAKIHPATPARAVAADPAALRALATGIKASLRHGLKELEGEEVPEYIEEGAPNPFYCYDRAGETCRRCKKGIIRAMQLGGRTSAFCPVCQLKQT